MQLTGVAGWPVAHSRSPKLHKAAFESLGFSDWDSQLLPIPPEEFEETVIALPRNGFVGINVTIPHKEAALRLATEATDAAKIIGAANTLTFLDGGRIAAANTDAPAIESAVIEGGVSNLNATKGLVFGAGGSARAAVHALRSAGVGEVAVWNRNPQRAEELAVDFDSVKVAESPEGYQVLVNATPVGLMEGTSTSDLGLGSELPSECELIVDLVYATGGTELQRLASRSGVTFVDGLEILVRQGAMSVEIWTGHTPPLDALREAVADS